MSTSALIVMVVAWSYILFMVVYFFTKVLRKERENKGKSVDIPLEPAAPDETLKERKEHTSAKKVLD